MPFCKGPGHHKHPPRDKDGAPGNGEALTVEQKQQMKTEFEQRIQQDITDGKLTQEKANEMLNDFNSNAPD